MVNRNVSPTESKASVGTTNTKTSMYFLKKIMKLMIFELFVIIFADFNLKTMHSILAVTREQRTRIKNLFNLWTEDGTDEIKKKSLVNFPNKSLSVWLAIMIQNYLLISMKEPLSYIIRNPS